jgi:hypothetical protein
MSITIETPIHFKTAKAGRKRLIPGDVPPAPPPPPPRVPRVARLMALAIHFDGLIRKGIVRDYADLARLGGITRARVTQIMNLLNLAPKIQEQILFLPGMPTGRAVMTERGLRQITQARGWARQTAAWASGPGNRGINPARI